MDKTEETPTDRPPDTPLPILIPRPLRTRRTDALDTFNRILIACGGDMNRVFQPESSISDFTYRVVRQLRDDKDPILVALCDTGIEAAQLTREIMEEDIPLLKGPHVVWCIYVDGPFLARLPEQIRFVGQLRGSLGTDGAATLEGLDGKTYLILTPSVYRNDGSDRTRLRERVLSYLAYQYDRTVATSAITNPAPAPTSSDFTDD